MKGIELDVRLSADGQIVVMHDATVDRTTNGTGRVADLTAEQLGNLDARGEHPDWPAPLGVPTLHEVLDAVAPAPDLALRIEVKRDEPARLERVCAILVRLIDEHGIASRVVVSSFDPAALEIMRAAAPGIRRAFITSKNAPGSIRTATQLRCASVDLANDDPHSGRRTGRARSRSHGHGLARQQRRRDRSAARLRCRQLHDRSPDYGAWLPR